MCECVCVYVGVWIYAYYRSCIVTKVCVVYIEDVASGQMLFVHVSISCTGMGCVALPTGNQKAIRGSAVELLNGFWIKVVTFTSTNFSFHSKYNINSPPSCTFIFVAQPCAQPFRPAEIPTETKVDP